jgi:SAM-dependent methyltransferase
MERSDLKAYDLDPCVVEIYDATETQTEDVALIRRLLAGRQNLAILEPFCGTGRILIPLAEDGHRLTGLDRSGPMLASARGKVEGLAEGVRDRISLLRTDVLRDPWPGGFDAVVLGGNCLYELATPAEQEAVVRSAAGALKPGGWLYLDNNHMEGDLAEDWRKPGIQGGRFPTGVCSDGTRVEGTTETIWFDAAGRLVRFRRTVTIHRPNGGTDRREWVEQKHPPSTGEMMGWLRQYGFTIENLWGDRRGTAYTDRAGRAIFHARLTTAS